MKQKNYPEVLIETETSILQDRIKNITAEELYFISTNFERLYKEYEIQSSLDDKVFFENLDREIKNMN
jgi:hypothetical protein